jgi:hypothetical protein
MEPGPSGITIMGAPRPIGPDGDFEPDVVGHFTVLDAVGPRKSYPQSNKHRALLGIVY